MNKILAISIIAMTAVTAANAQIASKQYVDDQAAAAVTTAEGYTDTAIGDISGYIGPEDTEDVATAIANAVAAGVEGAAGDYAPSDILDDLDYAGNSNAGVVTQVTEADGVIDVTKAKVTTTEIADNAGIVATQLASGVQTSLGYADAYHTASQSYGDIITHNASEFETAGAASTALEGLDYAGNSNAGVVTQVTEADGVIDVTKAKVTTTEIADNAGIVATQLASGVQTSLGYADAYHTASQNYGDIITHNASEFETAGAASGAVAALSDTQSGTGNVVTGVTQSNGAVTVTKGNVMPDVTAVTTAGHYVLTADVTVDAGGNTVANYGWELIQRGTNGN